MMPAAFALLENLPLTPNGKLDRRSLPAPGVWRPELGVTYAAPETEVEQTIATVWQQVLRLEKVGMHDNFFDLGGHSLLLVQVHSKLQEVLTTPISMVELFKYPTISALAKSVSQESSAASSFQQSHDRAKKQKEAINKQKQRRQAGKEK
ncbi:MAG: hypothetical protein KME19_22280 [Microcoleus vaginatus WJT46-NPBG5]|nr:hypothetical protein [Microcoleus vaginatus WJT46-NPBG5]